MSSVQISLVVINTSGIIARVTILLRKFKFIPTSQKVSETNDPALSKLVLIADGSGNLVELSAQLLNIRGVTSILSVKDTTENSEKEPIENTIDQKPAHIIEEYNKSKKEQNEEILRNFFGDTS